MKTKYNSQNGQLCPKTGKPIKLKIKHSWLKWLCLLTGLSALIWFLVRVIPKPSRAAYPCQRVAAPLASGFVLWLIGLIAVPFGYRKAKEYLAQSRLVLAIICFTVVAVAGLLVVSNMPQQSSALAEDPLPNTPMGIAKGIYPGRVVWVYDPNATDWQGTNSSGDDIGDGYWWQSNHTNQAVVNGMMSQVIRTLTGKSTDNAAWDAIFRYFNQNKGKGDVGYQPGEKIMLKANLVTTNILLNNVDAQGNQTKNLGWVNTSPQMIVALLQQLVDVVGVEQDDITIGDTTCYLPNHYWNYCHSRFPNVHYMDHRGTMGRLKAVSSQGYACETPVYWSTPDAEGKTQDYLPVSYAEAAYLINFAVLKGHSSGITLCGKNDYGSFIRLPPESPYYDLHLSLPNPGWSPGMGHYRAQVDIMGNPHIGGKTLLYLIDGLYGGYYSEGCPVKWNMPPFNGDWPSSLFASQDPVAIDSVGYDFLLREWPRIVTSGINSAGELQGGAEDYLHEAAFANEPSSGVFYDPNNDGIGLTTSLGVHEHWNDSVAKQYSRNIGTGDGIELLRVDLDHDVFAGDLDGDHNIDFVDFAMFASHWLATVCNAENNWCGGADIDKSTTVSFDDLNLLINNWMSGF